MPVPKRPALTNETNEAIERRLHQLETKPSLDLDAVGEAVRTIRSPGAVATRLAGAVRYSQRVEAEVAGLSIEVLLPHATDDYDGRFLTTWVPDELGHAEAQEVLLTHLDLPLQEPRLDDAVPAHNGVAGLLGRLSRSAYEMTSMAYHAIGAINERLASAAYSRMAEILEEMGETRLAGTLFRPMRRDESLHLGYYRTYARQLRSRLAWWQLTAVRALIVQTYAPVGAGDRADKPLFGEALEVLEDDPENPAVAHAVHDIAHELLARTDRQLPPFVLQAMQSCLRLGDQR
jgi:hypothetical protein